MNKKIVSLSFLLLISAMAAPSIHCSEGQPEPGILSRLGSWLSRVYYEPFVKFVKSAKDERLKAYQQEFNDIKATVKKATYVEAQPTFEKTLELIQKNIDKNIQSLRSLSKKIKQGNFKETQQTDVDNLKADVKSLKKQLKEQKNTEASNDKKKAFYDFKFTFLHQKATDILVEMSKAISLPTDDLATLALFETMKRVMDQLFDDIKKNNLTTDYKTKKTEVQNLFFRHLTQFTQYQLNNGLSYFNDLINQINETKKDDLIKSAHQFRKRIKKIADKVEPLIKTMKQKINEAK